MKCDLGRGFIESLGNKVVTIAIYVVYTLCNIYVCVCVEFWDLNPVQMWIFSFIVAPCIMESICCSLAVKCTFIKLGKV